MGSFDLRCCLSGLPTTWGRTGCSMLLLEEVNGRWYPLTPPVRGQYDTYGRIEQDDTELATAVGARLTEAWDAKALTADFDDLDHQRDSDLGGEAAEFLGLGTAMVFNNGALHLGGHRVLPALWLEEVREAIAATAPPPGPHLDATGRAVYCDWLLEQGRPALAEHLRVQGQRGLFGSFSALPSPPGFEAVVRWAVEQPGGLQPITQDSAGQFTDADEHAFARQAWGRGDLALRRVVAGQRPKWVAPWQDEEQRPRPQAPVRRYVASERYAVGDWVAHPRFGQGQVETVEAAKVLVRFGRDLRPLAHARA